MRTITPFTLLLSFIFAFFIACGDGGSSGPDCDPGTELCSCISGQCLGDLECDLQADLCTQPPTTTTGNGTDSDSDSGGSQSNEDGLCERLNECNYLEAGVSAADCSDELSLCTGDLITSAYSDWNNKAEDCLELSNCKNFRSCVEQLPDCAPVEDAGMCVEDGMPCDYCWGQTFCPAEYLGGADGCDCDCSNGVDPDCG